MSHPRSNPTFGNYLLWLFSPFFRWWWAVLTGLASLLGFLGTPDVGLQLTRLHVAVLILVAGTVLLLGLATISQGWILFHDREAPLRVIAATKARDFNADLLFVLEGHLADTDGAVLEVRRLLDNAELPFCVVRVVGKTQAGHHQAATVWTSSAHLRAFNKREFDLAGLRVRRSVDFDQLREVFANVT